MKSRITKIWLIQTPLAKEDLERYSSATTLTVIELEVFPELVQAQWLANMMSPSLWEWIERVPKRSGSPTRRRVEGIKQHIIHNYSFTHMEGEPGMCPCGVTAIREEEKRFADTALKRNLFEQMRQTFLHGESTALADLLGVEDIREHYGLSGFPMGTVPIWGNEVLEKMDAYRFISTDGKGSGKCESLAALYAAALIVVGRFPWHHVSLWFTPAHVMTYLMEGRGYLSSNKRMFSPASLRNVNEHTAVIRSCLESQSVTRVQTVYGTQHSLADTCSVDPKALDALYSHMRSYATSGGVGALGSWPIRNRKRHEAHPEPINLDQVNDSAQLQQAVREAAARHPGSVYDLARYAFRTLDVDHPECYAYTARHRSPKAREKAEELGSVEAAIDYVQSENGIRSQSIFGSTERIAMPDEVLIFGRGDHRDKALLLYALLCALEPEEPEPVIVFTRERSFVVRDGRVIPAQSLSEVDGVIELAFNAKGAERELGVIYK